MTDVNTNENTDTNIAKNNVKFEPIDNKLGQLHALMNIVQNTLEMPNGDIFNDDIAKLMEVGKNLADRCRVKLHNK